MARHKLALFFLAVSVVIIAGSAYETEDASQYPDDPNEIEQFRDRRRTPDRFQPRGRGPVKSKSRKPQRLEEFEDEEEEEVKGPQGKGSRDEDEDEEEEEVKKPKGKKSKGKVSKDEDENDSEEENKDEDEDEDDDSRGGNRGGKGGSNVMRGKDISIKGDYAPISGNGGSVNIERLRSSRRRAMLRRRGN